MNITIILSIATLGSPMMVPVSDHIPKLNVETSCKTTTAEAQNMTPQQAYDACMRDEDAAQQHLATIWSSSPASLRDQCEGEATIGGYVSYVDLLTCMQMSTDWANASSPKSTLRGASKKQNQN